MACNHFYLSAECNLTFCFQILFLLKLMTCFVMSAKEWWRGVGVAVAFVVNWVDERLSLWDNWDGSHFFWLFIFSIERGVVREAQFPKKCWPFDYKTLWIKISCWTDWKVFSCKACVVTQMPIGVDDFSIPVSPSPSFLDIFNLSCNTSMGNLPYTLSWPTMKTFYLIQ